MKIAFMSDLHLEWFPLTLPKIDADVLVLAGDIGVGLQGLQWAASPDCGFDPHRIVYLPGNHEFYHNFMPEMVTRMADYAKSVGIGALIRPDDTVTIDNVVFCGGTFWTDFSFWFDKKVAKMQSKKLIADYSYIKVGLTHFPDGDYIYLTPDETELKHYEYRGAIRRAANEAYNKKQKTVVCTHMAPHPRSSLPKYLSDPTTAAYVSDQSELILDHPSIVAWIHGHVHNSNDYMIGDCRVVSNPRGYASAKTVENKEFDVLRIIEV